MRVLSVQIFWPVWKKKDIKTLLLSIIWAMKINGKMEDNIMSRYATKGQEFTEKDSSRRNKYISRNERFYPFCDNQKRFV